MADNKKIRSNRFNWGAGDLIIEDIPKSDTTKASSKPDEKKKTEEKKKNKN